MPLYEYQCSACGAVEEAIQKFSDPPLTTCRHCSGKLSKLISQSSFHLKGTGWYVTDYSKKAAAAKNAKPSDASGTAVKPDTKTDTASSATKADD